MVIKAAAKTRLECYSVIKPNVNLKLCLQTLLESVFDEDDEMESWRWGKQFIVLREAAHETMAWSVARLSLLPAAAF